MQNRNVWLALATIICSAGVATARPGADIITGDVVGVSSLGAVGNRSGYAFGTTSCNIGNCSPASSCPEPWVSSNNQHPLIGQNLYRLKNGRFEMIGMSWLKHASITINNGICGSCSGPTGSQLHVGCSDPYGSGLNSSQSSLGPKSEVNAFTGAYPYPYVLNWTSTGNATFKRVSVLNDDLNPTLNAGAIYFGEGHYISNNEALQGNGFNNSSYRRMTVSGSSAPFGLAFTDSTQREKPGIQAWKDTDSSVTLQKIFIPNEGLVYVGAKAYDNGNGTWRYEYAIYNHNSHRSVGSFSIPAAVGVNITNIGFKDVDYHSGEEARYTNNDWPGVRGASDVSWATVAYDSGVVNASIPALSGGGANAIRWGSLYNFWFTADQPPVNGNVNLGLWRPGTPNSITALVPVPMTPPPPGCPGDTNGDNTIDSADLSVLLSNFGQSVSGGASGGDFNNDGHCDVADLSVLLSNFGSSC